jgi:uncharacterized protein (TIGR02118 family)
MIRVSVLYPTKDGARFDWAYYTGTHIPLVGRKLGSALKSVAIEQGIGGGAPGSPAPFVAIANLTFDSVPAFETAFRPHAVEIMADIPKYTSIEPLIQISEVKIGA